MPANTREVVMRTGRLVRRGVAERIAVLEHRALAQEVHADVPDLLQRLC